MLIRIGETWDTPIFNKTQFLTDLDLEKVEVFAYVYDATLFEVKSPDDHEIVAVIGGKMIEVYQDKAIDLFFAKVPIKSDFLKTKVRFDPYQDEGMYYKATPSLDSFANLYIRKSSLADYSGKKLALRSMHL